MTTTTRPHAPVSEPLRDRLRRLTDEARARAEAEAAQRAAAERAAARAIIAQIPEQAEEQARTGRNFLVVMDVTYDERPLFTDAGEFILDPDALTGPSRHVFAHCVAEGLEPTLVPRWTSMDSDVHRIDFSICIAW